MLTMRVKCYNNITVVIDFYFIIPFGIVYCTDIIFHLSTSVKNKTKDSFYFTYV